MEHRVGRLPVVRLDLPDGLWAMNKLHDPAVAHLRQRNDLSWALHRAAHALMTIKSKWEDDAPVLGPGYYLQLGPDDEVGYAEPSGRSFTVLRDDVKDLREELYRVVHQMAMAADSTAPRSRMSAASKERDWDATEIVLSAYADLVLGMISETLRVVAAARGDGAAGLSVKGLDGWQQEDLSTFLEQAAMAVDAHALSPTFRRTVAKRQAQRLLQDETDASTLRAIEGEIDAADVDPAPYRLPPTNEMGSEPGAVAAAENE